MAKKISQLESATDVTASDLIQVIDVEDDGMAVTGTNKKATAQLLANELGKLTNVTATGSTTARSLANRFADVVNVKDFGAKGDGITNDYSSFVAAFSAASGKKLKVPSGIYRIEFTGTNCFSTPSNMMIDGDGASSTELVFIPSSSSYRNLIVTSTPLSVSDIKISLISQTGGSTSFFTGQLSGLIINNCTINGGVINSGASLSHSSYLINFPTTGTQSDIVVSHSNITRFRYGILKTNTSTSTQKRLFILNNDFYENYDDPCQFNSPSGVMDDILVQGNTFRNSLGVSASLTTLLCSFASCTNFRVIGNTFSGPCTDALHIEEGCVNGSISTNTFNVDGNAITLQDNNVGGTYKMPLNISISSNTITKSGTVREAGKNGIWLINDATPEVPGKRIIVESNSVSSFDRGIISASSTDDAVKISNNISHDCNSGFFLTLGVSSIDFNISSYCDIGITTSSGGSCIYHKFVQCTNAVSPSGRPLVVMNPTFEWSEQTVTSGSTNLFNTFTWSGNQIYSDVTGHVICDVTSDRVTRLDQITAGASFARTNIFNMSGGGSFTLDCVNNSNALAVQLFSSANRSNVRIAAFFNGTCAINP